MNPLAIMRTALVLWLAAAASVLPFSNITRDGLLIGEAVALAGALVFLAGGLRLARVRPLVVHGVQLLFLGAVLILAELQIRTEQGQSVGLRAVAASAITQLRDESAPLSVYPPTRWLLVAFIALLVIVTDVMVSTLGAPAWALLPLATPYIIATLTISGDLPWWQFALVTLGYLAMLAVEAVNRNEEWTRNVNSDTARRRSTQLGVWRMALLVGLPALVGSLVLGSAVPLIGTAPAIGKGSGNGPIRMQDPTINLSQDLNQPVNRRVLTYTTSNGQPVYLRLATLSVVDASGWKLAGVSLLNGRLPSAPGAVLGQVKVTTHVTIDNLDSEYLPVPYSPVSFSAPGAWAYDPTSLMVLSTKASGRLQATRNLSYTVTSAIEEPTPTQFAQATAGVPPRDAQILSNVPADVPQVIIDLAHKITQGAASDAIKAADIQAYLTDPTRFTYDTTAPSGTGYGVLVNFLTKTHSGYCIHFASAMALMARIVGIPSRVSVGFAPGTKVGNHYEVDIKDAHAWPELYFEGYGWVRFEPTAAVAGAPSWTSLDRLQVTQPTAVGSAPAIAPASTDPTQLPSVSGGPVLPVHESPTAPVTTTTSNGMPGRLALALVVMVLLVTPMSTRWMIRQHRLAARSNDRARIAAAWREIHDSLIDLGGHWINGSPRAIGERLASRCDTETAAALRRVAHWVELARYAPSLPAGADLAADVRTIRKHWFGQAGWRERAVAVLLPRSLWSTLGAGIGSLLRPSGRVDAGRTGGS